MDHDATMADIKDDFTTRVTGSLDDDGVWQIDATVTFRDGLDPQPGDKLLGDGRLALLQGIVREGLRGRSMGATQVRVRMDIGGQVSRLSPDELEDLVH